MKNLKKTIIIAASVIFLAALILINSFVFNPKQLTIREEILVSDKLDTKLDNMLVAYFSDFHYGSLNRMETFDKAMDKISSVNPDVIIFGGDLIEKDYKTRDEEKEHIINGLLSLKAPYGKYAVLGDLDETNAFAREILEESGFIILDNRSVKICVNRDNYFNLVGIANCINGSPEVNKAFEGINIVHYTLAVTHCPDEAGSLPLERCDYVLSAHSLGGQVYLPIINLFNRPEGAESYLHGKNNVEDKVVDITNGVGMQKKSIRFMADAEIVLYRFTVGS